MSNSLTRETPLLKRGYLTALDPPLGKWFTATFLIGWWFISLLLATPVSMAAGEESACNENSCTYPVKLDRAGFYTAVVTLPAGQSEGVWSLLINPKLAEPRYGGGGFFAGSILKERGELASWIGFSLAKSTAVQLKFSDYTGTQLPFQVWIDRPSKTSPVYEQTMTPGLVYNTPLLKPGFYVTNVLSSPDALEKTFFGVDITAPNIYGGVVGGWLDSETGPGYAAFYLSYPRTMEFELMFDGLYGTVGTGQPHLEIYYQEEEGTREVYWSAPRQDSEEWEVEEWEVIEPTIPVVLPEPAVLPPDPGDAGKTTLEGIDSDKDGVRDDIQRYIASTYPNPEDKPFRAALREYSAFQQPFMMEADDKLKTIANAENRAEQIDCVLYLHPEDGQAGLVNLRAEYLNTESRTHAYLNADGQLSGQPISLTPSEDLPQLCEKFTTRSSFSMTRSSRQGASCKTHTGTVIGFSNGAMTDAESTQRELAKLKTHVESAKANSAVSAEKLSYVATYNSTKNWINRLLDSVLPKMTEESPNSISKFWRWLGNTEQPPQTFIDVSLDIANDPTFVVSQDLQSHVGTYRTFIDEGRKVVVVAHSEGNFYATQAYASLNATGQRARTDSFGIVSIASGSCAMASAGSAVAIAGSGCTNLQTDQVISAASTVGTSVSISNSVVHTLPGFVQDLLGHSFLSYLEGDISGPKIVNDVITAIPKLTPSSPIVSQGVITVRLEWGEQPNVNLHVYEPNGSHVYYAAKQGVSGYLDLDDKDGEGPEHYYAKCETLQQGLYKVAVNYFSGTGPETARINISAGEMIRSYTVPLASADAGATLIPVAAVKVTQDEQSGEFKFDVLSQKTPSIAIGQEVPQLIITEITDPQTNLGLVIANSNKKELFVFAGEKNDQGELTSVTDITYTAEDVSNETSPESTQATSKTINFSFGNDISKPKLVVQLPDGNKIEAKNYHPDTGNADLSVIKNGETVGQYPNTKIAQEGDWGDQIADDIMKGTKDMLGKIIGTYCSFFPPIIKNIFYVAEKVEGKGFCNSDLVKNAMKDGVVQCRTKPLKDLLSIKVVEAGKSLQKCKGTFEFNPLNPNFYFTVVPCLEGLGKLFSFTKQHLPTDMQCEQILKDQLKKPNGGRAASNGDPHLYTFDKLAYDFQGAGEFILVKSMVPNDLFEVQVRQQPWGKRTDVAITQATAMNVAGDRIGFYIGQIPFIKINGVPKEISEGSTPLPKGGRVVKDGSLYSVVWPNDNGLVEVKDNHWGLLVNAYITNVQRGQLLGLLGNADGDLKNDVVMRDSDEVLGTILETKLQLDFATLYPKYADSWRITQQESLFDYAEGETTETFTDRNFPYILSKAENLDEATRADAEKICRDAGITDPIVLEDCILDVALTGEKGFADKILSDFADLQGANILAPPSPMLGTPNFGQFNGLVYDAVTKQLINNAKVKLTVDEKPLPGITVKSTSNGFYETDIVPAGSGYRLAIEAEGYISEQIFALTAVDGQAKEVEAVNLVPVVSQGRGNIAGTARNALNNTAIPGLTVSARRYINNQTGQKVKVTGEKVEVITDQNGMFNLENLEAGNYTLEFIGVLGEANYATYIMTAISIGGQTTTKDALITPDIDAAFRIVLNWDSQVRYDLDAHLTGPKSKGGRFHIYFSDLGTKYPQSEPPYAGLFRDDKDRQYPETEIVTIGHLQPGGVYRFSVHDFSHKGSTTSDFLAKSGATVAVYNHSGLVTSVNVPNQPGTLWTVFEIDESGTVIPVNTMGYEVNQGGIRSSTGIRSRKGTDAVLQPPVATDYWPIVFQGSKP